MRSGPAKIAYAPPGAHVHQKRVAGHAPAMAKPGATEKQIDVVNLLSLNIRLKNAEKKNSIPSEQVNSMLPATIDLVQIPFFMSLALLAGVLLGISVERFLSHKKRRARRQNYRWRWNRKRWDRRPAAWSPRPDAPAPSRVDASDQLRIVMAAEFTIQSILNKSEARVFKELDRMVIDCNPAWQVMAQVSLGEILRSKNRDAYGCINSKRVDLILMDENCRPRHALEYQGHAHYHSSAAARDAVKKEALRKAGIGYHEILAGHTTPSELKRLVEKLVEMPPAPSQ